MEEEGNILLKILRTKIHEMDNEVRLDKNNFPVIPGNLGRGRSSPLRFLAKLPIVSQPGRSGPILTDGTELRNLFEEENPKQPYFNKDQRKTVIEKDASRKRTYLFTVEKLLGKGSYGRVVQAKDPNGKACAIKILDDDESSGSKEQNVREVKIMKFLSQLNCGDFRCIQMIKSYELGTCRYLQFPLYGPTVKQMIRVSEDNGGNGARGFIVGQIKEILAQLFLALNFLHDHYIFHTDIKTDNIIFIQEGWYSQVDLASNSFCVKMINTEIRLIDFGLALFHPEKMEDIQDACCKIYQPPECILKTKISYPVDIWCTGLVTLAMYLGKEVFKKSSTLELLAQMEIVLGPFPPELLQSEEASLYFLKNGRTKRNADFNRYEIERCMRPLMAMKKHSSPETDNLFATLKQMLRLDSRDRPTSKELLEKF